MKIHLSSVGKRYRTQWLYRGLEFSFEQGKRYSITGHNGSGKSTLLLTLAGFITPTEGKVLWLDEKDDEIERQKIYQHLALCGPSIELFEELTLAEMVEKHFSFREQVPEIQLSEFKELCGLDAHWNKPINHFSSGMRQRLKLALCLFTRAQVLLLDEPAMNLDARSVEWYQKMLDRYTYDRTVIIATNNPTADCPFQTEVLAIARS